jgi:hypothetical protein
VKRSWIVALLGLLAMPVLASRDANKLGPNQGGGDASMFEFCAAGGQGVGYVPDSYGGTFSATCANYNWSGQSGGVVAGQATAAGYKSATTPGGNTLMLRCTGVGVGVGSDGVTYNVATNLSGTLTAAAGSVVGPPGTFVVTGANFGVNALRDQIIDIIAAGGGPTAGTRRYIKSNTSTTITVDGSWPVGAPVNGATTAFIYDPMGSLCHAAGELVYANAMADIELAQDHTRIGGTVYFPNTVGGNSATIYADRMCGRKGNMVSSPAAPLPNNCPVLRPPQDEHLQKFVQRLGARNWKWEGIDADAEENGRQGAYLVSDMGSINVGTFTGFDGKDGTTAATQWSALNGTRLSVARQCAMTGGTCTPASGLVTTNDSGRASGVAWGRLFTLGRTTNQTSNDFCANNQVAVSGTCRDDRRVQCTAGADCTTAGLTNATCDSALDAMEFEVVTQKHPLTVAVQYTNEVFPENGTSGTLDTSYGIVTAVPKAATCGDANFGTFTFSNWPGLASQIRTGIGAIAFVLDEQAVQMNGTAWEGGTWSPNNWFRYDANKNGISDPGDCLSGGTESETDDEPECDAQNPPSNNGAMEPTFKNLVHSNCSAEINSCMDGNDYFHGIYENMTLDRVQRSSLCDLTDVDMRNVMIRDSFPAQACAVAFHNDGRIDGLNFWNVKSSSGSLLQIQAGVNTAIARIRFEGGSAPGLGALNILGPADQVSIEDVEFIGIAGEPIYISAINGPLGTIQLHNIRASGNIRPSANSAHGQALVTIGRAAGGAGSAVNSIQMSNLQYSSGVANNCLVQFDDDTGAANTQTDINRSRVAIRDGAINSLNGVAGARAICIADLNAVNGNSTTDTGIFLQRFIPTWQNLTVNGVPIADQPYPDTSAAGVNNCNLGQAALGDPPTVNTHTAPGTFVMIHDDTVANQTCTGAGTHVLTGGGTFRSVCKCLTTGLWGVP